MKKTLAIGIPVALAVVALGGPAITGNVVEKKLDAALERIEEGGILVFRKKHYQSGYFASEGEWDIELNPALKQMMDKRTRNAQSPLVTVRATIENGPFLFADGFSLGMGRVSFEPVFSDKQKAFIEEFVDGGKLPVKMSVAFDMMGNLNWRIHMDAFKAAERSTELQVKPAHFDISVSANGKHSTTTGSWDGMEIVERNKRARIGAIHVNTNGVRVGNFEYLWLNNGEVSFDGFSVLHRDKEKFSVGQLKTRGKGEPTANNTRLNMVGEMTLAHVAAKGDKVLEDGFLKMSIEGIDTASLDRIAKVSRDLYKNGAADRAAQTAAGMQLMGILPELLGKGFVVKIDELRAKVQGSPVSLTMKAEVQEGFNAMAGAQALEKLTAEMDVSVPRQLVVLFLSVNPEMIDSVLQQGYVIEQDGVLKTHAEFKNMQLTLNGKAVPLPGITQQTN